METLTLPDERAGVNTDPVLVEGERVGVLSDIHVPYHDKQALETSIRRLKKDKIDSLVLLGDVCDFYSISRHDKDPFQNNFAIEARACRELLAYLRGTFKKIPIYFKIGNHEERWENYLLKNAPELSQLDTLAVAALLHFKEYGVRHIDKMNHLMAGGFMLIHGHEVMKSGGKINPAYKLFQAVQTSAMCGHLHRSSEYMYKSVNGWVRCYTIGALCNLSPRYYPHNSWNHGFARVDVYGDAFSVTNYKIFNGVVL